MMAANQDSNAQHLMYPQHSYAGYQSTNTTANTIGAWNQSPQNQTPYAIPYHGDMASYTEKASYGGTYPPLQYNTRDTGDYYHQSYGSQFAQQPHQQTGQWSQQSAYQQQTFIGQQPVYNSYGGVGEREGSRGAAGFNPGAPPPNMARPPPNMKRENGENTFHASLSMLENPAQTAAAYTASWVSSTSSIPPELRDEPEVPSFNGSAHSGGRDDLVAGASAVFTPPVNSFADQFGNMSLHESKGQDGIVGQWENKSTTLAAQQWPGLGQEGNDQTGTIGQSKGKKRVGDDRERRSREEPRELTWEERLRKAAVQKERVEQRGTERGDRDSRDVATGDRGVRNRVGQRGAIRGGTRNDRSQREKDGIQRDWKNEGCDRNQNLHNGSGDGPNGIRGTSVYRGVNRGGTRGGLGHNVSQILPTHGPFPPGPPPMIMPPRGPFMRGGPPPPPVVNMQPQDQRFKNTWLDASFMQPFPMPFPPIPFPPMDPRFGGRGRGRGGQRIRGGFIGKRPDGRKDLDKKEETDMENIPAIEETDIDKDLANDEA